MVQVAIGLGTNLGDRAAQLKAAVQSLDARYGGPLKDLSVSAVYESPAMMPEGAPPEWNKPFYNMAVRGETMLNPQELLAFTQSVEKKLGRKPRDFWAPREIDLDILVYCDVVIQEAGLKLPHPGLATRDFVLVPLADVWPDWCYPKVGGDVCGKTAVQLLSVLEKSAIQKAAEAWEIW